MSDGLSQQQMQQIEAVVRQAIREEFAEAGLRLDGPDHVDFARRDFMFVRSLRLAVSGVASKVGFAILIACLGGFVWLVQLGFNAWRGS